jgi:anti-sigma regulatory factor (Ser/Thr protein kinase)
LVREDEAGPGVNRNEEQIGVDDVLRLEVRDSSQVSDARRRVERLAKAMEFPSSDAGRAAIAVSELASNLARHGQRGEILLRRLQDGSAVGLEILSLDFGPGMANLQESLRDGHSTAGSKGIGLGAVRRLASFFDIYTRPDWGTAVLAGFWPGPSPDHNRPLPVGGVAVPLRGEESSGDAWAFRLRDHGFTLLVVDGLGHGAVAATASREALRAFAAWSRGLSAARILEHVSVALRPTRGATAAVAEVDLLNGTMNYAGIGNIRSLLYSPGPSRSLVSMDGILGHNVREVRQFSYPWPSQAVLVMATDGLDTRWDLSDYPGLASHHPSLIAGVLFRGHRRERDDATVVVVKGPFPRVAATAR